MVCRSRISPVCLVLALAFGSVADGQGVSGVISGAVTPQKAANNSVVTITDAETGVVAWTGKPNSDGIYRAPGLAAGRYNIAVTAAGFKRQQVSDVELAIDQRADILFVMQAGEAADAVTVEGRTEGQLESDSSSLVTIITPSQLQDLPLPSRN